MAASLVRNVAWLRHCGAFRKQRVNIHKECLRFEWDPKKADANLAKHDVAFEEALTVFADPLARIFSDDEHSVDELREIIMVTPRGIS